MSTPKERIAKLAEINASDLSPADKVLAIERYVTEEEDAEAKLEEQNSVTKVELMGAEIVTIKGVQGDKGDKGDTGEQGIQGEKGDTGADSKVIGPKGEKGDKGQAGKDGKDGIDGKDGVNGINGKDGNDGSPDGPIEIKNKLESLKKDDRVDISAIKGADKLKDEIVRHATEQARGLLYAGLLENSSSGGGTGSGVPGPQGSQGSQGSAGANGATGATGSDGARGSQGSQGSIGIQGATGPQGSQGSAGVTGPTGADGVAGARGSQGTQGSLGSTGPQGTQGSIGVQGSTGNQGSQGSIGLQGTQGTQGSLGPTGATGPQGSQGSASTVTGPTGATGPQGTQGTQGSIGVQGTQGSLGPTGATGSQGNRGTQGTQGTIGVQGTQGTQGSQGSIGPQGATGSSGSTTPTFPFVTIFETSGRFTLDLSGGTITFGSGDGAVCTTTATTTRYANLSTTTSFNNLNGYDGSPTCAYAIVLTNKGTTGQYFFGLNSGINPSGTAFDYTQAHIGFKIEVVASIASLYATQGAGVAETASSALTTVTGGDSLELTFKINGSASVDYYWIKNGGAKSSATNLTTNLPTGGGNMGFFNLMVNNKATATTQTFTAHAGSYIR